MIYVLINALIEFGLTLSMTGRFIAYLRLTIPKNTIIHISVDILFSHVKDKDKGQTENQNKTK